MKKQNYSVISKQLMSVFIFLFASSITSAQDISEKPSQSYQNAIAMWHQQRIAGLKKEHGWLSLISLDWLSKEKNIIPSIGIVTIRNEALFLELNKDLKGIRNGKDFSSGMISADKDKIIIGTKAISVIKRDGKYAARIWDAANPKRKSFRSVDRFPVHKKWKIEGKWEQYKKPKKVEIQTVIPGIIEQGTVLGVAIFLINGKEYRLEPTVEEGASEYFFVFADQTNGKETYGGGRFLDADPPKNGKIILDFNKCINPPCAFTEFATCPTPTQKNRLSTRIEAGEKAFHHD